MELLQAIVTDDQVIVLLLPESHDLIPVGWHLTNAYSIDNKRRFTSNFPHIWKSWELLKPLVCHAPVQEGIQTVRELHLPDSVGVHVGKD